MFMHQLHFWSVFLNVKHTYSLSVHDEKRRKKTPISYGNELQSFTVHFMMYSSTSSLTDHNLKPSLEFLHTVHTMWHKIKCMYRGRRKKKNIQMLKRSFGFDKKLKCILMCANFRESKEHASLGVHVLFCGLPEPCFDK